ncbi:hypothetical protein [Clostridium sp.]|uniref:hypothetical protein n=1 Tax=Clostridium sp. TaxID=1506 RepID=UPI0025BBA810|nr:hypothetical protein [Clostridium sp.]
MVMTDRNFYIIKQSDGTTWTFSFKKDEGIIYKFFKENTWSDDHILTEEALKNFSVILLPDDSLNVLYQDSTGTIILNKYDGEQWNKQKILTNEKNEIFSIYFKTAVIENKIQIIFSIFNKANNTATLFHQILDEMNNLSSPKIIDTIKYYYDYNVAFILYSPDNKELFIMYQRFVDSHEIGYKSFNKDNETWSDFKLIDSSKYPFNDYSAIMFNQILHTLYIKREDDISSLNYVHGNNFDFKNTKIFKGTNIESCMIFIIYGEIWCFWIDDNEIYSSFSIENGNDFSTPPYNQNVNSSDIFKSIYITNEPKEIKGILGNEIYFTNDDTLQNLIISNLYPAIKNNEKSDNYLSYIEYYMSEICSKVLSYKKTYREKEQLISMLQNQLAEQKAKSLSYQEKFKEINNKHTKFTDLQKQLNKKVNLLQENLNDKEEKLKSIVNLNMEKEIISLEEKLSQNANLIQESLTDTEEKLKSIENLNIEKEKEILFFKEKLSQNINFLQESLTNKEEKLKLLENINMVNEKEILSLKDKVNQEDMIILYLIGKFKNLNNKIKIMSTNAYNMY